LNYIYYQIKPAMKIRVMILWIVMPCNDVAGHQISKT